LMHGMDTDRCGAHRHTSSTEHTTHEVQDEKRKLVAELMALEADMRGKHVGSLNTQHRDMIHGIQTQLAELVGTSKHHHNAEAHLCSKECNKAKKNERNEIPLSRCATSPSIELQIESLKSELSTSNRSVQRLHSEIERIKHMEDGNSKALKHTIESMRVKLHALHAARETECGEQYALRQELERVKEGLSESKHNVFKLESELQSLHSSGCTSEFDGLLHRVGELETVLRNREARKVQNVNSNKCEKVKIRNFESESSAATDDCSSDRYAWPESQLFAFRQFKRRGVRARRLRITERAIVDEDEKVVLKLRDVKQISFGKQGELHYKRRLKTKEHKLFFSLIPDFEKKKYIIDLEVRRESDRLKFVRILLDNLRRIGKGISAESQERLDSLNDDPNELVSIHIIQIQHDEKKRMRRRRRNRLLQKYLPCFYP